ncbi:MAG: alpha/beta hydrolase [Neomegalonema sp.]|nr:alpha/beta hydrolase [Neomegalonema sp.]
MEYFLARDGRRLAYRDTAGAGPAVLCLGGLTRNGRDFAALSAYLQDRYRVIRLDSRGRGESEHARQPLSEYTIPVEAGDAIGALDHLGVKQAAIVGTSRGGILAMAIAGGAPERVTAVILNDVGAEIEGRGLLRIFATLGRQPAAQSFDAAARDLADANQPAFKDVSHAQWLQHAHDIYDDDGDGRPRLSYDPHLRSCVAATIEGGDGNVSLWPLFEALRDKPLLIVRGRNSDVLAPRTVDRMAAEHPSMMVIEIANRGHAPFLNEREALTAIDAFLERHHRSAT